MLHIYFILFPSGAQRDFMGSGSTGLSSQQKTATVSDNHLGQQILLKFIRETKYPLSLIISSLSNLLFVDTGTFKNNR